MKYQAFTNDSLAMMHHGARGALAVDDELSKLGAEPRFKVRTTSDWTAHAADLETEMVRRGMSFEAIDLSTPASPVPVPPTPASEAPTLDGTQPSGTASDTDGTANVDKVADQNTRLSRRIAAVLKMRPAPAPTP